MAILLVVWLGLIAAAEADPVVRGVLVAAVAMAGCVGAMVCVGRRM